MQIRWSGPRFFEALAIADTTTRHYFVGLRVALMEDSHCRISRLNMAFERRVLRWSLLVNWSKISPESVMCIKKHFVKTLSCLHYGVILKGIGRFLKYRATQQQHEVNVRSCVLLSRGLKGLLKTALSSTQFTFGLSTTLLSWNPSSSLVPTTTF